MHQEKILRFRVYRVWNIPERPSLHNTRELIFSSADLGNAEEFAVNYSESFSQDKFVVEDSGKEVDYFVRSDCF